MLKKEENAALEADLASAFSSLYSRTLHEPVPKRLQELAEELSQALEAASASRRSPGRG